MICQECKNDMYLDDVDFNFRGNKDEYWCCNKCQTSCINQIRFGTLHKQIWHTENNNIVKDYIIDKQGKVKSL